MFVLIIIIKLWSLKMKITIKDLKQKNAPKKMIEYFKNNSVFKQQFGKKIYELKVYSLIELYYVHWFIKNFKYKKIRSVRWSENKNWYRWSYNFTTDNCLEFVIDAWNKKYKYIKLNENNDIIDKMEN
jgi:hypothetical protein